MLADHPAGDAGRQIALQRLPRLTIVRRYKHVRVVVIGAMPVERYINSPFGESRRNDPAHISTLGNGVHLFGYVLPRPAAVTRNLKVAVVGTRVQQALFE